MTGANAKATLGTAEGKADAPKEEIRKMSGLASLFKRDKISRPQPIDTADNQQHVFPGTNIKVQSQRIAATGGDYKAIVFQHLSDINAFPIGRHFLQALTAAGKNVLIVYGGPNVNQAAGSVAGYVLLRRYHDAHENANFAAELQQTMTNAGLSTQQLAQQLLNTQLHNWAGNITPNPFQGLPILPPPQPRPGAPAVPPKPPSLKGEVLLNQWLAGTSLPTYDQMDVLMLTLPRRHIKPGNGVGTRINYDPHKTAAGGMSRPPQVALFHELMHAYYNAKGAQLGREDSIQESNGGRLFELMAVGMRPFDIRPFSENRFRWALGVAQRLHYP